MVRKTKLALIIADPGRFRESLRVLLAAVTQIDTVRQVDCISQLGVINGQAPPAVVLLDFDIGGDTVPATLARIRTQWPQTRTVVLANDEAQQQVARDAGADAVLTKGILAAKLYATVDELLAQNADIRDS